MRGETSSRNWNKSSCLLLQYCTEKHNDIFPSHSALKSSALPPPSGSVSFYMPFGLSSSSPPSSPPLVLDPSFPLHSFLPSFLPSFLSLHSWPLLNLKQLLLWLNRDQHRLSEYIIQINTHLASRAEGQVSCEGMPASVGRPTLICALASSIKLGEESAKELQTRGPGGLSPTLVAMATNGRGGSCGWMEHGGRAGTAGGKAPRGAMCSE